MLCAVFRTSVILLASIDDGRLFDVYAAADTNHGREGDRRGAETLSYVGPLQRSLFALHLLRVTTQSLSPVCMAIAKAPPTSHSAPSLTDVILER